METDAIYQIVDALEKVTRQTHENDRALLELTKALMQRVFSLEKRIDELELLTRRLD